MRVGPFRFSAQFYDTKGQNSLNIYDNEWQASAANWDLEVSAGKIQICESQHDIHLILTNKDPTTVEVNKIRSVIDNKLIAGNQTEFQITDLQSGRLLLTMRAPSASNCVIGMMM
jgi:hypothetical protein